MHNPPPPPYNSNPYLPPGVIEDQKMMHPNAPSMPQPPPEYYYPSSGASPMYGEGMPMPPPPPPMHMQQPAPQPTPIFVGTLPLGRHPTNIQCPHCRAQIVTKTNVKPGLLTWLLCGGLAFFGCFICCCVPFCVDSCQDIEHFCPSCKRYLGTYKRI